MCQFNCYSMIAVMILIIGMKYCCCWISLLIFCFCFTFNLILYQNILSLQLMLKTSIWKYRLKIFDICHACPSWWMQTIPLWLAMRTHYQLNKKVKVMRSLSACSNPWLKLLSKKNLRIQNCFRWINQLISLIEKWWKIFVTLWHA